MRIALALVFFGAMTALAKNHSRSMNLWNVSLGLALRNLTQSN